MINLLEKGGIMMKLKRFLNLILMITLVAAFATLVAAGEQAKVNINTASAEELVQVKGIGPKYAERIVDYREKNGPFNKVEDIMMVKGIGAKTFESIKDLITADMAKK